MEGDREQEILDAALEVLAEVGYDRLTMDAVATRAKASKATLYRRWTNKLTLVIDALVAAEGARPSRPTPAPCAATSRRRTAASAASPTRETVARFTSVLTAIGPRPGVRRGLPHAGARPQGRPEPC